MSNNPIIKTEWHPEQQLIITQISGEVNLKDVEEWEESLLNVLQLLPDQSKFKIFINLHGFKAANLDAHKRFRNIVPLTLAQHGWKVGYLDLFEESKQLTYTTTRGIECVAAVHVHQDETKIHLYESKFSRTNEHFYTDVDKALSWISDWKIPS